jgi:glycosyltransferase involved in cell wall biosynthesis
MVNNSVLVFPLYCDEKKFWNMHRLRLPDSYFFAGRLYYEKGIDNVLNLAVQNPKVNFYFLGEGLPKYITRIANVGNCSYLGGFPDEREKMVEYYNMFENFVSLPVWMDTGPTKVVEAELCGCKLVLNDNNKIRTWNWKDVTECRKMIKESTDKFFERIEECIQ